MPAFFEGPDSEMVRCHSEKCPTNDPEKNALPYVRPIVRYLIRKPNEYDRFYRATQRVVFWYCCSCNNLLAKSEFPADPSEIVGVPELLDR